MKQQTMWCQRLGKKQIFMHFSPSARVCHLYGEGTIYEVIVCQIEAEMPNCCWAWWDLKQEKFTMIYPAKMLLKMCFPYGPEIEEKLGRGEIMPVSVEVVQEVVFE